jgi:hypothetical protein
MVRGFVCCNGLLAGKLASGSGEVSDAHDLWVLNSHLLPQGQPIASTTAGLFSFTGGELRSPLRNIVKRTVHGHRVNFRAIKAIVRCLHENAQNGAAA